MESMKMELPSIPASERTPLVECLLAIIDSQQQQIQRLEESVQTLRDEIAVLKGQKPRPKIAPSCLEAPLPKEPPGTGAKRPGSEKRSKNAFFLTPVEVKIPFPHPPPGSVSNGYVEYFVQELVFQGKVTRYLRERIRTPDGQTLLAPLPDDVLPGSHFGLILIVQRNELSSFPQSFFPDLGVAVAGDSIPLLSPRREIDYVPLRLRGEFGGEYDLQ
jgi:hypothetical protein